MARNFVTVRLNQGEIEVCHDWTVERIKPENINRYSHAIRFTDDASTSYAIQMNGKVCEAGAHKFCLGNIDQLYRGFEPDKGSDLKFFSEKFDVKGMQGLYRQYLLYSRNLWPLFDKIDFSALMMARAECWVKTNEPNPRQWSGEVQLTGWVTKAEFKTQHKIAGEGHQLKPGTPHMHVSEIRELDEIGAGAINCPTCGARGVFGYRHPVDGMRWYCSDHRLGQWYADARR